MGACSSLSLPSLGRDTAQVTPNEKSVATKESSAPVHVGQATPIPALRSGSQALFDRRGVGIWLAYLKISNHLVGFCGFLVFPTMHSDPQLVYAMYERFADKGYATEMARAAIAEARKHAGFREIIASVDEINAASQHVLDKLGFSRFSTQKGHFGNMILMRLGD